MFAFGAALESACRMIDIFAAGIEVTELYTNGTKDTDNCRWIPYDIHS